MPDLTHTSGGPSHYWDEVSLSAEEAEAVCRALTYASVSLTFDEHVLAHLGEPTLAAIARRDAVRCELALAILNGADVVGARARYLSSSAKAV